MIEKTELTGVEVPETENVSESKIAEENQENNKIQEVNKEEAKEKAISEELQKLKEENETLKEKIKELEDAYRRKLADFDNYRKRMLKQFDEAELEGVKKVMKELLPVIDNFERALVNSKDNKNFDNLLEGLKITYDLIMKVLEKFNVKPFNSEGEEFDHNLHEALIMEESEDARYNYTVAQELEKGYKIGDSILRHAKVKVIKKKELKTKENKD